jgi:diaminohydroxyphosphoribosylaminopyrimidine deaminase/5-amino-6-(5-phosphoribosylamino)uracil reductase
MGEGRRAGPARVAATVPRGRKETVVRDVELMARAVTLGARARRSAPPNPWVGCVLARDGEIVGEGFHLRPGEPHAEVVALGAAGHRARGATAYVSLEPCAHTHRTGPCADALVDAGITRVVTALEDPDARVRGRGIERLRAAGLRVDVGTGEDQAARSLAPYLHHRRTGRAFCLAKVATSLDGRAAAADGSSRWITGEAARRDAHELRAESQAIVVGAGTALVDRPALTVRGVAEVPAPPMRVLLDARGRVPADGPLFELDLGPTLVLTSDNAPPHAIDTWRAAGAKVEVVPRSDTGSGLDLAAVLELLGRHDVLQAMFEGGAQVHGALVAGDLVDRLVAYVAPLVLGTDALPAFGWPGPARLEDAQRLALTDARMLGDDVRLDYTRTGDGAEAWPDGRDAGAESTGPWDGA